MSGGGNLAERALWDRLRGRTKSRIGLGRAGDALDTAALLELGAAHAMARDAVHSAVDVDRLVAGLTALGFGGVQTVHSLAPDRPTYLRRPDLGRLVADLDAVTPTGGDLGIVVCDGLSADAVDTHAVPMVSALLAALPSSTSVAPPVVASQARVALGDHVAARLGVGAVVVFIGERPGLSVADSLGAYLSYRPRPGMADSERNCVSNIHPPDGLGYERAAHVLVSLLSGARELGRSGVDLKDGSADPMLEAERLGRLGAG
jgi:ethanolamine ammonia-lyase small subunit